MSFSKRYTIFNFYIRGSNQMPQGLHALNNFWKNIITNTFSKEATELWHEWAFNGETEITLQGGKNKEMEDLFDSLSQISHIPAAKFNESEDDAKGLCTVVSFVADERMISAMNHLRVNRISPAAAFSTLMENEIAHIDPEKPAFTLTEDEALVASKVAFMPLATGI